jgi:hypothetical protein
MLVSAFHWDTGFKFLYRYKSVCKQHEINIRNVDPSCPHVHQLFK